ncbi:MAG: type I 3-dehydroquinate dehydratase [Nitrososphaerota archaeon]|nr:type I 3-dehydroquinate dehydratase [Nitrososphaerota archaeon]MDG6903203.1 type I 3-dehydroquinate dehydratase [Nitrososphaerota archaeon]MDG6911681.1 type I 3-dehydroquinate dehydratase [Nitrososphaerota archaeon]MDG6960894.1 type I 3-dehydroquinate dehydratase [Nitrososphaerota archaeon]MDG6963233.1 type I 3-dehydroquinate dehydratase [Nitrososphaerota archaeon]
MVCTSVRAKTPAEQRVKAQRAFDSGTDLVEFRLDSLRPFPSKAPELSEFLGRAILTVRSRSEGGCFEGREPDRLDAIRVACELRPAYVDVELRTLKANPDMVSELAGQKLIVSWHDCLRTPPKARLASILADARAFGGLAKLVPTARQASDNLAVLSLYDGQPPAPIAFCMGEAGVLSRVMAIERRTPIAYASLPGEQTAPGQLTLSKLLTARRRLGHD